MQSKAGTGVSSKENYNPRNHPLPKTMTERIVTPNLINVTDGLGGQGA